MTQINELAREVADKGRVWRDDSLPFSVQIEPGHPQLMVVAGENCSGKSLFVKHLCGWGKQQHGIACLSVSIRERVGGGLSGMDSIRREMMFGNEAEHSTGATSAKVVDRAFDNVHGWSADGHTVLLVLDEPEIGLSEGYAGAMGRYLARKVKELPAKACGVAVVTHSRSLARALRDELGTTPSFALLGSQSHFDEWLGGTETRSVEELLALAETDRQRWRVVGALKKSE